jgi:hypothetical protein
MYDNSKIKLKKFKVEKNCLSPFVLLSQITVDWIIYKQQEFLSFSSGGWEVKI